MVSFNISSRISSVIRGFLNFVRRLESIIVGEYKYSGENDEPSLLSRSLFGLQYNSSNKTCVNRPPETAVIK